MPQLLVPEGFAGVGTKCKITNVKVFGVSLTPDSDRPYVFVKLETNQGVIGWGEGTLEGKAAAVMACVKDFRDFLIGADPMQVEHHWQSMYVHSFYRAGPVIGLGHLRHRPGPLGHPRQGARHARLQAARRPARSRGVRGYYHVRASSPAEITASSATPRKQEGVTCFKTGIPGYYEWIETHAKIERAVKQPRDAARRPRPRHRHRRRLPRQDQPRRSPPSS